MSPAGKIKVFLGSSPLAYSFHASGGFIKVITSKGQPLGLRRYEDLLRRVFYLAHFPSTSWRPSRVLTVLTPKQAYLIEFPRIAFKIIKRAANSDLIISPGYGAILELMVLLIVSKLKGIPLIVRETHWYWPRTRLSRFLWYIYYNMLKMVNGLICPGLASYKYWRSFGFQNVYIVHYYALESFTMECSEGTLKTVRRKYNIPDGLIILYLGRLIKKKGVDIIIKAFAKLVHESIPDKPVYLVIAGDGPEKPALSNLARELGVADRVIFTGPIPEDEKECFYKLADIFVYVPVMTTIPEEWGIAPLEALRFGVPTVVSNIVGSLPEIKDAVVVVNERDVDGLRKALEKLLTSSDLRNSLRINAEKIISKLVNEYNVYRELLEAIVKTLKTLK